MVSLSQQKRSGFTMIELLVVIAIIAILAFIITATFRSQVSQSRDTRREATTHNLALLIKVVDSRNESQQYVFDSYTGGSRPLKDEVIDPHEFNIPEIINCYVYGHSGGGEFFVAVGNDDDNDHFFSGTSGGEAAFVAATDLHDDMYLDTGMCAVTLTAPVGYTVFKLE
jgi:prepilin-type N-terminal cleavage/methylation domain-containing protein